MTARMRRRNKGAEGANGHGWMLKIAGAAKDLPEDFTEFGGDGARGGRQGDLDEDYHCSPERG